MKAIPMFWLYSIAQIRLSALRRLGPVDLVTHSSCSHDDLGSAEQLHLLYPQVLNS